MPAAASRRPRLLRDFATIYSQMWYRDFPLQRGPAEKKDVQRADWNTHIGVAVRSTADLLGLFTRFESGGRTDAVLRENDGRTVAMLEWEWTAIHWGDEKIDEIDKLKKNCAGGGGGRETGSIRRVHRIFARGAISG